VHGCRDSAAQERRDDEQPYLAKGGPAQNERGTEAAGWVHQRAGDRNAEEVNHREGQPDDYAGSGRIRCLARRSEDGEDERGGQDDLGQEGTPRIRACPNAS
jgi:hypothetical protein